MEKISLSVRRSTEHVYSSFPSYAPDYKWRIVDKAGHVHAWVNGQLPSLKMVIDEEGGDDYPDSSHYECIHCGEHIVPMYVEEMASNAIVLTGPLTYVLETEHGEWIICEEDYNKLCELLSDKRAAEKTLKDVALKAIENGYLVRFEIK